jgi:hypothetical protein
MYPAVVLVCFIMVITIPLAVMLLLAGVPLFFVANIIGTTLVGKQIAALFRWNVEKRHFLFLIGVPAGLILSMIPFVNFLAFIFFSALGWCVYVSFLLRKDLGTVGNGN